MVLEISVILGIALFSGGSKAWSNAQDLSYPSVETVGLLYKQSCDLVSSRVQIPSPTFFLKGELDF